MVHGNINRLDSELRQLVADEREGLVLFLRRLDDLERERGHLVLGFHSLWDYLLRGLGLRESAAGRRIAAMRLLRRFPALERPLADGRLCVTTLDILAPLLTPENVDEIVRLASHLSKRETLELAARLRPRTPPREGIRALPVAAVSVTPASAAVQSLPLPTSPAPSLPLSVPAPLAPAHPPSSSRSRIETMPCSAEEASMRVTIDRAFRERLERARALASHKHPRGDLYAVLFDALGMYVEALERRKGLSPPLRQRSPGSERLPTPGIRAPIPPDVRRAVMARDGGRCVYLSPDGRRCGSTWRLELHHLVPAPITGTSRPEDLEVRCGAHNGLHAREDYGAELIDLVIEASRRRRTASGERPDTPTGEFTPAGGSR